MAQHKSAKKRIRRNARRAVINRSRLGSIRTAVKGLEAALASGDKAAAQAAFKKAMPALARGASKGVLHKRTVARKLSRLSKRVKSLGA
jgi:small subunit ribosomal protein S20